LIYAWDKKLARRQRLKKTDVEFEFLINMPSHINNRVNKEKIKNLTWGRLGMETPYLQTQW